MTSPDPCCTVRGEGASLDVLDIEERREDIIWRVVTKYCELRGSESALDRPSAYILLDGIFQRALLHHLAGNTSEIDAARAQLTAAFALLDLPNVRLLDLLQRVTPQPPRRRRRRRRRKQPDRPAPKSFFHGESRSRSIRSAPQPSWNRPCTRSRPIDWLVHAVGVSTSPRPTLVHRSSRDALLCHGIRRTPRTRTRRTTASASASARCSWAMLRRLDVDSSVRENSESCWSKPMPR